MSRRTYPGLPTDGEGGSGNASAFPSVKAVTKLSGMLVKTGRKRRGVMTPKRQKSYMARDICRLFDISKATLFRWEKDGRISGISRDWRNWRKYSEQNIEEIRSLIREKSVKR